MTNLNLRSRFTQINFPLNHAEAHRHTLARLYERRAAVEALIESLEAYERCRMTPRVMTIPIKVDGLANLGC